jgi:hypothetical protein
MDCISKEKKAFLIMGLAHEVIDKMADLMRWQSKV